MLKKHMAACLVVTAFAAAPALAQTSPSAPTDRPTASGSGAATSGSPAMQPGASSAPSMGSSSSSTTMSQSGGTQGQFMTQMQQGQMMASDLIGTRVVSTNNESIGDINDVIVDRNGQVMAAVVGVGGFLGIGEKDVAVPFNSLEFATAQQANAMDRSNSGNSNSNVTTTGSTATGNTTAGSTNMSAGNTAASASDNQPERVVLRMTKAELQAAPAFRQNGDDNANRSNAGTTGTTTTAPKQ
ncbi:PRC-barrel domain-containing protein [Microvirga solisilvae]|uniref:PRC-barrel domain-containing protein n=1 Tax=Microvirga solisilvae TaxID=2919498 RepID=UPI001FAEF86E|nr:PRC-barrel domain-containing protein [Microvirga solisilvae]